ncbi:hypothetical protein B0T10DRAFT_561147 [Thelonectria olida]|uniref:Uncharacterized protein n=1 Tax=Thelonectria olida TaxID=1576542 RepID=A0A9P8W5G0_9HYPO|nr:hypothetical protein B0T10DRAFT_561147 [Thelonectria olida]
MEEATRPHATHIPETALAVIATIVSLEQLSLTSGNSYGWRHQWLVDHTTLRAHLRSLSRLKKLALVRDAYPVPAFSDIDVEQYYSVRLVSDAEEDDAEARMELDMDETTQVFDTLDMDITTRFNYEQDKIWERAHRNRMPTQAEAYAAVLPALEWMFCGQRPMGFEKDPESATALERQCR